VAHACNPSYSGGEIRRITVQGQFGHIVHKTLSQKDPSEKGLWHGSGVGLEFKPQYYKKKV
jgi:hypothetical protein